ncbi:MAG: hypothetical protein ACLFNM_03220 [Candidatus Woesearchaeota archaeon]
MNRKSFEEVKTNSTLKLVFLVSLCVVSLLLVGTVVSAVDISDMLVSVDGNEVNYIQFQSPQVVSLSFTLNTPHELSQITANYSALNLDPSVHSEYASMDLLSSCDPLFYNASFEEPKGYKCSSQIILRPTDTQLNVSYDLELTNFSNAQTIDEPTIEQTLYFTQDTTNPQITSITSQNCVDSICYVGDDVLNKITFGVSDTLGSFYQKKLFFSLSGQKYRVNNCTDSTCVGYALANCDSKSTVSLQTTTFNGVTSSDDAGNYFTGLTSQDFVCDALKPRPVSNITLTANKVEYSDVFKQGDSLTAWVLVEEDSPHLKAYADLSSLTGQEKPQLGSCQELSVEDFGENMYNCSWVFSQIREGEHVFNLTFIDVVNQSTTNSSQITVDEFVEESQEELPEIFYDITAEPTAPEGYNRIAIDIAQRNGIVYPISADIKLQKKYAGVVETLVTSVDAYNCMYVVDEETQVVKGTFDVSIANPLADYDAKNKVLITIQTGADVNNFNSDFDLVCNASAIVRLENNKVYQTPDNFLITIPIRFKNSALGDITPGERVAQAIYDKEKSLREDWVVIGTANKLLTTLSTFCSLDGVIGLSQTTGTLLQMSGDGLEKAGLAGPANLLRTLAPPLLNVGKLNDDERATGGVKDIPRYAQVMDSDLPSKKQDSSGLQNILSTACEWVNCNTADKMADAKKGLDDDADDSTVEKLNGWWLAADPVIDSYDPDESVSGWDGIGVDTLGELTENIQTPNPKESMVTSIVTMCVPGMIYHLNQFREMQCQSLLCLKGTSKYGFDIEVCDQMQQQWICEKLVGEAFEIPGARQVKNLADNVNSFLQNIVPNALKIVSQNTVCKKYLNQKAKFEGNSAMFYLCQLPQSLGEAMNYIDKTTATAQSFLYESENDYCAQALGTGDDDMFSDMFGVDIPAGLADTMNDDDGSILASELLQLLQKYQSVSDGDFLEQEKVVKELQELGYEEQFLNSHEHVRSQISLLKKLIAKDSKTKIFIDENGQIDVSFSELGPFGDAYSQALSTCGHASIRNDYQNDAVDQYIDGYAQENNIHVYFYGRQQPDEIQSVNSDSSVGDCDDICINFCLPLGDSVSSDTDCYSDCYSNCMDENGYSDVSSEVVATGGTLGSQLVAQNILSEEELEEITSLLSKCKTNHETEIKRASEYATTLKEYVDTCDGDDPSMTTLCTRWKNDLKSLQTEPEQWSTSSSSDLDSLGFVTDSSLSNDGVQVESTGGVSPGDISYSSNFPNDKTQYSLKATQDLYKEKSSLARAQAARKKIANTMDAALITAAKNGMLDWMNLRHFSDDNAVGQVSSFLDAYIDSDSWKTMICSSSFIHPKELVADNGAAIECNNGVCQPVLSFASEKAVFNDTHQLYTFTFYVGGGIYEMNDERNEFIKFMPRFKEKGGKEYNFLELVDTSSLNRIIQAPRGAESVEDFNPQDSWMQIPAGQIISNQLTFTSKKNFTSVCFKFERSYPPNDPLRKKTYCRDISDESQGDSAWDTGRPTGSEDYVYDPEEEADGWLSDWDGRLIITA